jgi:hypothetical protein
MGQGIQVRSLRLFVFLFLFVSAGAALPAWSGEPFVIVELFSSQGCSSCPAADELFNQLAKQPQQGSARMYFLSFHVDYWDYLGWKDPFSNPEFTKRQYKYANILGERSTYTPQMIVNGRQAFIGSDRGKAKRFIKIYSEVPATNTLSLNVAKRNNKQVGPFGNRSGH